MEVTTLAMMVDTSGPEKAIRKLDEVTKSSKKAGEAAEQYGRSTKAASNDIKQLREELRKITKEVYPLTSGLRKMAFLLKGAGYGYVAKEIIRMADSMKQLEAQVRLVTPAGEDYNRTMENIISSTNRTFSSIDGFGSLFTRTSRAMAQYGKSSQEVLTFTEAVANAMRIGRASTSEQAAAMMQLSQALASGRLQGDEFRSLMETAPILMEQLAKSLGLTTHQLRVLSKEGKLTTQTIYGAIHGSAAELAEMASKIPPSLGEAMQVLFNNLTVLVGELDKATGFTDSLSVSIVWLGNHLKDIAFVSGAAAIGWLTGFIGTIGGATGAVGLLSGAFATLTKVIRANPFGLVVVSVATLIAYLGETGDALYLLGSIASGVAAGFAAVWYDATTVFNELWDTAKTVFSNIEKDAKSSASNSGSSFSDFFESTGGGFWGVVETAATVFDMLAAVTRTTYSYMFKLIEGFGLSVSNVWNNIKVSILESVKGFIDGIIDGLNQLPDWMLPNGGIGPVNIPTGTRVEDAFKPFNDVSFDKVMEEAFLLQSSEGMAAAVRQLKKEQERLKKAKKEATGGRSNNHGDLIEDIGGRGKTGKSAAERALQDFHRQLSSMVQDAMQLSDTIEQMKMNNGLVSAYHRVSDLQHEITANAEKYSKYTEQQIKTLMEQAQILDSMEQQKAILGFIGEETRRLDDMRFEIELIGKTAQEADRLRFIRELNVKAQEMMIGMSEQNKAALGAETQALIAQRDELVRRREEIERAAGMDWQAGFADGLHRIEGNMLTLNQIMSDGTVNAINTVGDAFANLAMTGKLNIRNMTIAIMNDFARMFAQMAVMRAFTGLFGGFMGGGASMMGIGQNISNVSSGMYGFGGFSSNMGNFQFADGGVFSGGVQMFANGGVVDSPTFFGMAGGRTGVMGEAGQEAIMPLARGKDGKLGVKASGGNNGGEQNLTFITNIIQKDGDTEVQSDAPAQIRNLIEVYYNQKMAKDLRPGGVLNNAIKTIK